MATGSSEDAEHAVAAAYFAISQGRRRSVDLRERQAQAACRFLRRRQEKVDILRRQ